MADTPRAAAFVKIALSVVVGLSVVSGAAADALASDAATLKKLTAEFNSFSGARLVFKRGALPRSSYYDSMPQATMRDRIGAARIALREIKKYPRGYLGRMGLSHVGIFDALVAKRGDGFRPYDKRFRGYLYYGLWNGSNAVVAAYYSNGQLPLTLHHEIFHHADGTRNGRTNYSRNFSTDDRRFRAAVSGKRRYPAARISPADLAALRKRAAGTLLRTAVSHYATKSSGEDQAETARHFMTTLPDSLIQVAEKPTLAGSQRILHVIEQYRRATRDRVDAQWFVDIALGRDASLRRARAQLRAAAKSSYQHMRGRLQPRRGDTIFSVWGREDAHGVNTTLRSDVIGFGDRARRLRRLARTELDASLVRAQLNHLRLLARYYRFIAGNWSVSAGTKLAFQRARTAMINGLPASATALAAKLRKATFAELSRSITTSGQVTGALARRGNRYLARVDAAISNRALRASIRRAQPAAVRLANGSGVSLHGSGVILTAGHVVKRLRERMQVKFPDGRTFYGRVVAISRKLDLAVLRIHGAKGLPSAALARKAPVAGATVVSIGQPGRWTPSGSATGYKPWHVSVGTIRGFLPNPLGSQSLGRTKHDAWTYWGHSGSPLFDSAGRIVAMHNSWDSTTAMRHAVPLQAIVHFLRANRISYRLR